MNTTHKVSVVDRVLHISFYAFVALLPVFFLPFPSFFNSSKIILVSTVVFWGLILLVIKTLREGKIIFPATWIFGSYLGVILIYILGAVTSSSRSISFIGFANTDTVFFIVLMLVLLYLVSMIFIPRRRSMIALGLILLSSGVLGIAEIVMILFQNPWATLFGSSSDLAIFFGLITIISLLSLELMPIRASWRGALWFLFVLSVFFLTAINVTLVWYVVGLFALISFVYSFSSYITTHKRVRGEALHYSIPMLPLILLIISVISILFSGKNLYTSVSAIPGLSFVKVFNLGSNEARPSLSATFSMGEKVLLDKHIFGVGPNRFREAWNLYKPADVNVTQFWNTDFTVGFSMVSSTFITLGILGILAWLWFIGTFVYTGLKSLFRTFEDAAHRFLLVVSCMSALYLWVLTLVYPPGTTLLVLAFIFTGLFTASLLSEGVVSLTKVSITDDPRIAFAGVSGLVILLISTVVFGYIFGTTIVSASYGSQAMSAYAAGDQKNAETFITKAIGLKEDDSYYRFMTTLALNNLSTFVHTQGQSQNSDTKTQLENLIQNTLQIASRAVALDTHDYLNWLNLGQVYQAVTSADNQNAYDQAIKAYGEAERLNPLDPSISLAFAQLERAHNDTVKAKEYISKALVKKSDYTDAYFLLSQILVDEGSIKDAIASAEAGTLTAPNNSNVFFQLGLLRYNNKDFEGAIRALERSLVLNPQYANAQYFLGLAYDKIGRTDDAIKLFVILQKNNPDNQDIATILANLQSGKSAIPVVAPAPEKKKDLPVKEKQ